MDCEELKRGLDKATTKLGLGWFLGTASLAPPRRTLARTRSQIDETCPRLCQGIAPKTGCAKLNEKDAPVVEALALLYELEALALLLFKDIRLLLQLGILTLQ